MKIFLDASVLLAAAGSTNGASRAIFEFAAGQRWSLLSSPWAFREVRRNLPKLPAAAAQHWPALARQLETVQDVVVIDRPLIFAASKDRPILFSALACAEVLLTLDKGDFADLLGGSFYGMRVRLPHEFLFEERARGRLR